MMGSPIIERDHRALLKRFCVHRKSPPRIQFRAMTVGIGIIASGKYQPDHAIIIADTRGTFEEENHFTNALTKVLVAPDAGLYSTSSGTVEEAGMQFNMIIDHIMNGGRTYSDYLCAVKESVDSYRRQHFALSGTHGEPVRGFSKDFKEDDLSPKALRRWRRYSIGAELILAAIPSDGRAVLFYLNGLGGVEVTAQNGRLTIGSGGAHANFWLSYRGSQPTWSIRRAAYCAFEAKIMADRSAFVSSNIDMIIANAEGYSYQSDLSPAVGTTTPPISLSELREMFNSYGPQPIEGI